MEIKDLSLCFHTTKGAECKEFYLKYFGAVVTFDYEWYSVVAFGDKKQFTLSFMVPQDNESLFEDKGLTLNFHVDNVDSEYQRLVITEGLKAIRPLADNPWGDRSFTILDPIGNILYIYSEIKPTEEFAAAYK